MNIIEITNWVGLCCIIIGLLTYSVAENKRGPLIVGGIGCFCVAVTSGYMALALFNIHKEYARPVHMATVSFGVFAGIATTALYKAFQPEPPSGDGP